MRRSAYSSSRAEIDDGEADDCWRPSCREDRRYPGRVTPDARMVRRAGLSVEEVGTSGSMTNAVGPPVTVAVWIRWRAGDREPGAGHADRLAERHSDTALAGVSRPICRGEMPRPLARYRRPAQSRRAPRARRTCRWRTRPIPPPGERIATVGVTTTRCLAAQRVVGRGGQAAAPLGAGVAADLADDVEHGRALAQHDGVVAVEPAGRWSGRPAPGSRRSPRSWASTKTSPLGDRAGQLRSSAGVVHH